MFRKICLLLVTLFLCGCGQQTLFTGVDEKDANDMVAILLSNQLTCDKVAGAEGTWNIVVDKSQFTEAVSLLNEAGYPKDKFSSLGDVFKKSGLVSSPLEERARFMYALAEQLSSTLTLIHGVVTARVHIVLPENDPYATQTVPSSASVFISYLPQVNLDDCVRDIRQLVTNSIEGLSYDKVNVVMFPAANPEDRLPSDYVTRNRYETVLFLKMSPDSVLKFWFLIGGFGLVIVILIAGAFFLLKKKQTTNSES